MLKVVQVDWLPFQALCDWHEEADEEQNNANEHEHHSVFQSSPKPRGDGLIAFFRCHFIVVFIEEIGKGNDQQAENGIQGI